MSFKVYGCCGKSKCTEKTENKFASSEIFFNVDSSGSIEDSIWGEIKEFLKRIINTLRIYENGIFIGITQFATDAILKIGLSNDLGTILAAVETMDRNLGYRSQGHLGLDLAREEFVNGETGNPKIIISISDGLWNGAPGVSFEVSNSLMYSSMSELIKLGIQHTYILADYIIPAKPYTYTYEPYYVQPYTDFNSITYIPKPYIADFDNIMPFISGLTLNRNSINGSAKVGIGGFSVNFAGKVTTAGQVLQYNLPEALIETTTLYPNLYPDSYDPNNLFYNGFIIPLKCSLFSASGYIQTAIPTPTTTDTITIHENGIKIATIKGDNFITPVHKKFILNSNLSPIEAGSLIEIKANCVIGRCQINLYFA